MCGKLLRRLVSTGDHDDRNLRAWDEGAHDGPLSFEHQQVVRYGRKSLRLAPVGLHDGMDVWGKLSNLTNKPLERPRCRRTENPDEPPRRGRRTAGQESQAGADDAQMCEQCS